jgi:hypothetical protein
MDAFVWMFLPLVTATGSALLAFLIMQARMDVAIAKERESLAEAKATINATEKLVEQRIRAAEEEARRRSFDDLLADIRVEERHYMKDSKSLFLNRKSMVLQERMFFRNIPLSNWVSHEFPVEEGTDLQMLAKACSIFNPRTLAASSREPSRLLPS